MKIFLKILLGLSLVATYQIASAQSYPTKPIRMVFPSGAGSGGDILTRALAERLTITLGKQVFVDNRPGANGNIGTTMVVKSEPDGYTLLAGYTSTLAVGPNVYKNIGYDPIKDLAPVAKFAFVPYVLVVHPSVPATNLKELIAAAKSRPGQLNFASAGSGGLPHLAGELLKLSGKIDIVHVPYKSSSTAIVDLLNGQVQLYFAGISSLISHIKSGKLRVIAVSSLNRSSSLPDIQTANESGLPGFDVSTWFGVLAPAMTPKPIIQHLYDDIAKAVKTPTLKQFFLKQGAEPIAVAPAQFAASLKEEIANWAKVTKAAQLKQE